MNNLALQDKLMELLKELQWLPDDLEVVHYTGLGQVSLSNVFVEQLNAAGSTAGPDDKIDCISLGIN